MIPLHIRAYLESPVVCDRFLPIDSILDYQLARENLGHQDVTLPGTHLDQSMLDRTREQMPLRVIRNAQLRKRRLWYYAASFAVWPEHFADGSDHWVKKFDSRFLDLLEAQRGRLNVASGRYRGYHMPVFYRSALYVDWYVLGERERIAELLATVTAIGKKTSQGWGAVSRWTVEPNHEDWSVYRDGQPMRAIPSSEGVLYGVRPSYWNPVNQTICILPA